MAVELVPARLTHVGPIANRMREADRIETAAFGRSPREALRQGLLGGEAWTVMVDGWPEGMLGFVVTSALAGEGTPWMLGTDVIYAQGRALLTLGPPMLARMFDSMRRAENLVSAENVRAIRLLRRWGFVVEADTMMIGGVAFLPFWWERS